MGLSPKWKAQKYKPVQRLSSGTITYPKSVGPRAGPKGTKP